jgi:hypothetical protein
VSLGIALIIIGLAVALLADRTLGVVLLLVGIVLLFL